MQTLKQRFWLWLRAWADSHIYKPPCALPIERKRYDVPRDTRRRYR